MKTNLWIFLFCLLLSQFAAAILPKLPSAPLDPQHPGSKIYKYSFLRKELTCSGRKVINFVPVTNNPDETFPVVIFAHDHRLGLEHYRSTFEHLAKKGVIAIFLNYDKGLFDRDWIRMGRDYVSLASCAIQNLTPRPEANAVVFSGHARGAYIASIAAGLAAREFFPIRANAVVLFEATGFDFESWPYVDANAPTTIVYSELSVKRPLAESFYRFSRSEKKQFITLKNYTNTERKLKAGYYWPLTKPLFFGTSADNAFHYYGIWKWLVSTARDLKATNPDLNQSLYVYGSQADDKGIPGLYDQIRRNF